MKKWWFATVVMSLFFMGPWSGIDLEGMSSRAVSLTGTDTIPPHRAVRGAPAGVLQPLPAYSMEVGTVIPNTLQDPVFLNVFEMIRGRVAGVQVSGGFNNYRVRIRGSRRPPLLVIDGMPFRGYSDFQLNSLLIGIPPADVDHIRVIKNLAEATIYGPGASSGVILVNTRRGELVD